MPRISRHIICHTDMNCSLEGAEMQEMLLKACEGGDSKTVEELLSTEVEFNVNCTDFLGRTPLQIALEKEDMQMIELLLPKSSIGNIEATLLHAINESKEAIACNIIRHDRYSERIHPLMKRLGTQRGLLNTDFAATSGFYLDTTPLVLAAQRELYTVVKLLLLRGSEIDRPHPYECACGVCKDRYKRDYMRYAHRRLNAYKGLTSTSYITLGSADPFAEAFRLKKEVLHLAAVEKYFKSEYTYLAKKLSNFLVKLIDNIRGTRELDMVLDRLDADSDKFFAPMARFRFAIINKEKSFVAHPSCQMKLNSIWFQKARFLQGANWLKLILIFAVFVFIYPVAAVIFNFFPWIESLSKLHTPAIKFMAHAYSFFAFLIFLVARSFTFHSGSTAAIADLTGSNAHVYQVWFKFADEAGRQIISRNLTFSVIDTLISVWILGMFWRKCLRIYRVGAREHIHRYNIYEAIDTAMLLLYITSFSLHWVAINKANWAVNHFKSIENVELLVSHDTECLSHWYFLNPDRYYWLSGDPQLISEILFAAANILSFARISYLLAANETLGPLQISLGRMTADLIRFVILFLVLFTAFMIGIDNLLWPFFKANRIELTEYTNSDGQPMEAGESFGSIMVTFRSIFWLTFGLAEYTLIDMSPYDLIVTQNAAYILLGAHVFCIVIVMLNMLIAMMSRSFDQIEKEADVEFKFARSQLYLEYCEKHSSMAVPLNLLPSTSFIKGVIDSLRGRRTGNRDGDDTEMEAFRVGGSLGKGRRHNQMYKEIEKINYNKAMKSIVQRFISDVTKTEDDEIDNNIDIVRQDILRVRAEITQHIGDQRSEQAAINDQFAEVKAVVLDVQKQQDELLQTFNDCVTKLNTFENMISTALHRTQILRRPPLSEQTDLLNTNQNNGIRSQSESTERNEIVDSADCSIS